MSKVFKFKWPKFGGLKQSYLMVKAIFFINFNGKKSVSHFLVHVNHVTDIEALRSIKDADCTHWCSKIAYRSAECWTHASSCHLYQLSMCYEASPFRAFLVAGDWILFTVWINTYPYLSRNLYIKSRVACLFKSHRPVQSRVCCVLSDFLQCSNMYCSACCQFHWLSSVVSQFSSLVPCCAN